MKMATTERSKTPPSGRSKKKHLSVRPFCVADFDGVFKKFCQVHLCDSLPYIVVGTEEQISRMSTLAGPKMYFVIRKSNTLDPLDKILCRNFPIQTGVILAMSDFFKHKMNPRILQFDNCEFNHEHIEKLQQVLVSTPSINNLSLNCNPNPEQNFHLLLQGTALSLLSLKFCEIDYSGMERIADELTDPVGQTMEGRGQTLVHLNLASNRLMDGGAWQVARVIRTNRTLMSINLADNKITSEGCIPIMNALAKFELVHEELVQSRRLKFEWYKQKFNEVIVSPPPTKEKLESTKKSVKSGKGSETPKSNRLSINTDANYHPLIHDCYVENDAVYCRGNHVLSNLNLAYNRISEKVMSTLTAMLNYQIENFASDKGLSRLSLQGNRLSGDMLELVDHLLAEKQKHQTLRTTSAKTNGSHKQKSTTGPEKKRPMSQQ